MRLRARGRRGIRSGLQFTAGVKRLRGFRPRGSSTAYAAVVTGLPGSDNAPLEGGHSSSTDDAALRYDVARHDGSVCDMQYQIISNRNGGASTPTRRRLCSLFIQHGAPEISMTRHQACSSPLSSRKLGRHLAFPSMTCIQRPCAGRCVNADSGDVWRVARRPEYYGT